ncbi:unnamed protein product [Dracunculus medinensis]|uniref:CULT domain-containing protein n=1 Tax=Dracunculus medinensis TaxID=318479 RepID=A0A3P7PWL3_DRAME|nr:unnamed protein product [Dracunculus medinensis]
MLTVSSVTRTVPEGRPSSAFSWFPGYQWTTHRCDSCMEHIGWEFTSNELLPRRFFGLTRGSIRVDYASPSPA